MSHLRFSWRWFKLLGLQILAPFSVSILVYNLGFKMLCRRYFDIALVAKGGRLGCGTVACPTPKWSSPVESTSAPQIISITTIPDCIAGYHCQKPQLWLNLAILPKLYSSSESSPEFACTLQNHPIPACINIFQYFNLCTMQLSQTLQAIISNAGECHSLFSGHGDCHDRGSQLIEMSKFAQEFTALIIQWV